MVGTEGAYIVAGVSSGGVKVAHKKILKSETRPHLRYLPDLAPRCRLVRGCSTKKIPLHPQEEDFYDLPLGR